MIEVIGAAVAVVLLIMASRVVSRMADIARVLRDELRFASEDVSDINRRFNEILQDAA